jgi:alcohol dehydrogenase class IV
MRASTQALADDLRRLGVEITLFEVNTEPDIQLVETGAQLARRAACDMLIGFGGGSVLDAAKAIAALATNPGDTLDYLEVIGKAQPLVNAPLPIIAIPTTAGTGAEVTRNAVLLSPEKHVKVSLRHALMLPRVAIVDPLLTHSLPPGVTASTGMDALTQLIEPYISVAANPLTDGFCEQGIARVAHSLRKVFNDGNDAAAREDMALASLLGGMALANARLGAVHGFAGPLGGMFPAQHGEICARLLPLVMSANLRALRKRQPESQILPRFARIAVLLTGNPYATAENGIRWLDESCHLFNIPSLGTQGVQAHNIPEVVDQARSASSMKGNPIELTDVELTEILQAAL